jgi:hypothetical protein
MGEGEALVSGWTTTVGGAGIAVVGGGAAAPERPAVSIAPTMKIVAPMPTTADATRERRATWRREPRGAG